MVRLSGSQREILRRMNEGWIPFLLQFGSVGQSLERRGFVKSELDDNGRDIYILTQAGRNALPNRAKATDQGRTG